MSKCFMRMVKGHSLGDISKIMRHNFRTGHVPNADDSKRHLNKVLVELPEGVSYKAELQRRIDESEAYRGGRKVRKDAVRYIDVMLSVTDCRPEDFRDVDAWAQANIKWLEDTFGKENVATAVLHMDESSPHIHALIIPMKDGKLQGSKMVGGIPGMRSKQNSYAEAMSQFGLERGVPYSKATHEDIQEFYGRVGAYQDLGCPLPATLETPKQEAGESDKDYARRIDRWHKQQYKQYSERVDTWYHAVMQKAYLRAMGEIERLKKIGFDARNVAQSHSRLVNDWARLHEAKERLELAEEELYERVANTVDAELKARYEKDLAEAKKAREDAEKSLKQYSEAYNAISAIMHTLRHNLMPEECEFNGKKMTEGEVLWDLMQKARERGLVHQAELRESVMRDSKEVTTPPEVK